MERFDGQEHKVKPDRGTRSQEECARKPPGLETLLGFKTFLSAYFSNAPGQEFRLATSQAG